MVSLSETRKVGYTCFRQKIEMTLKVAEGNWGLPDSEVTYHFLSILLCFKDTNIYLVSMTACVLKRSFKSITT